jgi:pyridoxine 5-phosphate synthase
MISLSVNINKIALIRNSRGGNLPDVLKAASDCEHFGAQGITVHPRPDERHIRYQDARDLRQNVRTELNIEGNPTPSFIELVLDVRPHQVTLVPDAPDALTSNAGWDTLTHKVFLKKVIRQFKEQGIRVSIFVDPVEEMVIHAAETGADRVELYTEAYAQEYPENASKALEPYFLAALAAQKSGLGLNAGHDLNLLNLSYFSDNIPDLLEVSIGHALVCDSLYYGLENTIQMYLRCLRTK